MKKFLPYILILTFLGILVPATTVYAAGTCWQNGKVLAKSPFITISGCTGQGGSWQNDGEPTPPPPNGPSANTPAYNQGTCWKSGSAIGVYPFMTPSQCSSQGGSWQNKDQSLPPPPNGPASGTVPQSGAVVTPIQNSNSSISNSGGYSATTTNYTYLAPFTGIPGAETNFNPADDKALGRYLNLMIKIFIGLAAVLAVVMIVMGGVEYMTSELVHSKEHGKETITNALLGLLIALGAYALLNTINPDLLRTEMKVDQTTIVYSEDSVPQTYDPVTKKYPSGILFGSDWATINKGINGGKPYGVPAFATMNNNGKECVKVGDTGCTSTIGLDTTPLHKIHAKCPTCPLNLTGGSEFWLHGGPTGSTTHKPPNSTIDISVNSALNKYIAGDKPLVNRQRYTNGDGLNYLYESNPPHWHIGP